MQYEFTLRCGEDAITKIKENRKKIVPRLLELHGSTPVVNSDEEEMQYKALMVMDKELRPSGTIAKASAIFSFHKVLTITIVTQ